MRKVAMLAVVAALLAALPALAAVSSTDLAKFLPDKLAGFQAMAKANTISMKMSGKDTQNASRIYTKDKAQMTVSIMSGEFVVQMSQLAKMQMTMENEDLSLKTIKVKAFPGRLVIQKKQKMVNIQIHPAPSILINIAQMETTDPKQALAVAEALDLKGLSVLK